MIFNQIAYGSGGNDELTEQIVARTISSLELNCSYIGSYAFYYCSALTTVSLPNCSYLDGSAFAYCSALTTINLPNCSYVGPSAFYYCSSLTTISLSNCSTIGSSAFRYCSKLTSFYILTSKVPTLSGLYVFSNTPMSLSSYTGTFGSIYVKSSLLTSFQAATNWSRYSARMVGV